MYASSNSNKENANQSENKRSDPGKSSAYSFADSRPEAIQMQQLQIASAKSQAGHPIAQLKKAGALSGTPVVQLASTIKYNTTDFDLEDGTKEIVGQKAEADLESGSPLNGSAPGDKVQADLMEGLKANGYKRMIRGHLMNGQLGGLGIALNLFPITAKANSQHKNHVENRVKELITKGKDVKYTVEVASSNMMSDPSATFNCKVEDLNPGGNDESFDDVVYSKPTKNVKSKGDEGDILKSKKGVSFPTKNLKKGWGEVGKGFDDKNGAHLNTLKHISDVNGKQAGNLGVGFVEGRDLVKGSIDMRDYAFELLDELENLIDVDFDKWTSYIDDAADKDIDKIIAHIKDLIKLNQ